jgi:hypothetical protein
MAKSTVTPELQGLLDREAIRDLPLLYCDRVWHNDIDGLVRLFSRDGEFAMVFKGKKSRAVGHSAMRKIYRQGLSFGPRPFIHNHVIELTGPDTATGRCYLDLRSTEQNLDIVGAGYYHDDYVKVRGVWKFARRVFTAVRFDSHALTEAPAKKKTRARAKA